MPELDRQDVVDWLVAPHRPEDYFGAYGEEVLARAAELLRSDVVPPLHTMTRAEADRLNLRDLTTGGYPSGDTPVSDLAPPPDGPGLGSAPSTDPARGFPGGTPGAPSRDADGTPAAGGLRPGSEEDDLEGTLVVWDEVKPFTEEDWNRLAPDHRFGIADIGEEVGDVIALVCSCGKVSSALGWEIRAGYLVIPFEDVLKEHAAHLREVRDA